MKSSDYRKLMAPVLRAVPGLSFHGRMSIMSPCNGILRGVYIEKCSTADRCYVWSFVQPVFEPPPFVVSFYMANRVGGSSCTWTVADADRLADLVREESEPIWVSASTPQAFADVIEDSQKSDPYALRARGLALTVCRDWSPAMRSLALAEARLDGAVPWMVSMRNQCANLRELIRSDPNAAYDLVCHWGEENAKGLGLSSDALWRRTCPS